MEELALKAILKYHVSRCVLLTRALIDNDIFPERVYFTYYHGLSKGNVKTLPTREGRVEFLELRPGYITAPTFIHCTNCTTTSSIRYEISIPITKNGFQFFLSSDNSGQYLTRWSAFGLLADLNRWKPEYHLTDFVIPEFGIETRLFDFDPTRVNLTKRTGPCRISLCKIRINPRRS